MAAPEQTDKRQGIEFYGVSDVYSESGIDLTLLRSNLRRSIEERWDNNCRLLAFAEAIRQSRLSQEEIAASADASKLVKLLARHRVRYVIVGGYAMYAHGVETVTQEIDLCYQRTPTNLTALAAAFTSLAPILRGALPDCPFHFNVPIIETAVNFALTTDWGDINLLGEVSGVGDYDQVFAQSVERTVYGVTVRILSVNGLIAAKKAASRVKDRLHLLELEELKKMLDAAPPSQGGPGPALPPSNA